MAEVITIYQDNHMVFCGEMVAFQVRALILVYGAGGIVFLMVLRLGIPRAHGNATHPLVPSGGGPPSILLPSSPNPHPDSHNISAIPYNYTVLLVELYLALALDTSAPPWRASPLLWWVPVLGDGHQNVFQG